jgi:MATE family multidrug resistance protein
MTLGFETLGGRAVGAGHDAELGHMTLCCMFILTLVAGLVSVVWTQAEGILLLLGQEPDLAKMAARYLHLMIPSLFAHGWTAPLVIFLQSQGVTTPLAWTSALTLMLHVPCNW